MEEWMLKQVLNNYWMLKIIETDLKKKGKGNYGNTNLIMKEKGWKGSTRFALPWFFSAQEENVRETLSDFQDSLNAEFQESL